MPSLRRWKRTFAIGTLPALVACGYTQLGRPKRVETWETPQGPVELAERSARPDVVSTFPRALAFRLEKDPLCHQRVSGVDEVEISERSTGRRRFGTIAPVLGTLMAAGGVTLFVADLTSDELSPVLITTSIVSVVTGVSFVLMGKPIKRTEYRTRTVRRPARSYLSEAECPSDLTFAWSEEMMTSSRLKTPWGATLAGRPGFELDGNTREDTVLFSTRGHEDSLVNQIASSEQLRAGWTLELGSRTFPIKLSREQAQQLRRGAQRTVDEQRATAPPPTPTAVRDPFCELMQELATDALAHVAQHETSCSAMASALDEVSRRQPRAVREAEDHLAPPEEDMPRSELPRSCGLPLAGTARAAVERCKSALPAWTEILWR